MKIKLNIDTRGYKEKPSAEAAAISDRTRCQAGQREIEPAQLLEKIRAGYTFTPALIGGDIDEWKPYTWNEKKKKKERKPVINPSTGKVYKLSEFWQEQQIIAIDIDNNIGIDLTEEEKKRKIKVPKKPNDIQLNPGDALDACRSAGLNPYCIHKTFSYSEELKKYRVLFILDKPITEFSIAENIIDRACKFFNDTIAKAYKAAGKRPELCADKSIEPVKLIFGSRADCIIYQAEAYTKIEAFKALPDIREARPSKTPENTPKSASNLQKGNTPPKPSNTAQSGQGRTLEDLDAMLKYDIATFDLASYIQETTTSTYDGRYITPCPICNHGQAGDGSLEVTGELWHCFSSYHSGRTGGRIIEYLIQKHDITVKEAFDMFKFDIMGYDRKEWKEAYKAMKLAEAARELPSAEQLEKDFEAYFEQKAQRERDISDYEPPTEAEIMQALDKYQEIDAGEISAPVPAEDPAGAEDPGADPAAQEQGINAADPGAAPGNNQGPADPAEDPNMQSLEANMPPTAGKAPSTPRKTPGKIINAADYLRPAQDGISGYDADIAEVMQYAGRKMGLHPDIDRYLTLYPGLAVMGGQASLGKTTFCVNIASKLLERGEHVLYFALEQTPDEIMTKAAARYIYEAGEECAADNIALNSGARDPYIEKAISELAENSRNFNIIDCDFETTAAEIIATCEQYMRMHPGVKPIPIIDYLQIIAPPADFKGTKGEAVDENLKALKKWQKNNGLFVLLISSFNRSNNILPVSYESFMLTSAIEYTCDYVFGLQLQLLDPDNKEFYIKEGSRGGESDQKKFEQRRQVQEANAKTPKEVQFVSLKNRKGKQFFKANFNYYPAHDFFEPIETKKRIIINGTDYGYM